MADCSHVINHCNYVSLSNSNSCNFSVAIYCSNIRIQA